MHNYLVRKCSFLFIQNDVDLWFRLDIINNFDLTHVLILLLKQLDEFDNVKLGLNDLEKPFLFIINVLYNVYI